MARKLASVREIAEIKSIEGADRIVAYRVDGWWVIGQKDQFKVGDLAIYLEIDSWVPYELAPFLSKGKEPREFNGVKGERLKTIRMKGQLSQGLLLPIDIVDIGEENSTSPELPSFFLEESDDLTGTLGIQLWEQPVKLNKHGQPIENREARKGGFPLYIPKSDQERIQNCTKQFDKYRDYTWEVTEKLDGSSMTVYVNNDDEGVCSRNINLRGPGMEGGEHCNPNNFWKVALRDRLIDFIKETGRNLALQGELIGPGIQGNPYKLEDHQFYLYNIWDIDTQSWIKPEGRLFTLAAIDIPINHVPILATNYSFSDDESIDTLLKLAEGPSSLNHKVAREGLVFKANSHPESFKAISNSYIFALK